MILQPDDIRKYFYFFPADVRDEIFFSDKYNYLTLSRPINVTITQEQFDEAVKKWTLYNVKLPECTKLNNEGIACEKAGKIDEAISIYEQNVGEDKYPATHAYDRLLVIYRRNKDYTNEKRIAELAAKIFGGQPKYAERLAKINEILSTTK